MTALRYDQAGALALAAEVTAGTPVLVLRAVEDGSRAGSWLAGAGDGRAPAVRSAASSATLVATAVGAALSGVRPVVELYLGADTAADPSIASLVSELAFSPAGGGVTLRILTAPGGDVPPSEVSPLAFLAEVLAVPGVKVAAPATPADCYRLVRAAVHDPGHVVVLESESLGAQTGEVAEAAGRADLGRAEVVRPGDRLTIVASRQARPVALGAAAVLSSSGIEAEVIDPRWLAPFDDETVAASLSRTSRLLVVADEPLAAAWASALVARVIASHFASLDAPPQLVGAPGSAGPLAAAQAGGGAEVTVASVAAAGLALASW
ncbi:MAG TPA: transketolase C-terminal domain-containing protein [Acidimicrobiales bacterium]|nr:transketolase C-terminal domain-containing protein [Acidimicrobiales bacterium]